MKVFQGLLHARSFWVNDAIVDAADKFFASDYFEARQRFRDYVREASVGDPAIYAVQPVGLTQPILRGLAPDAPQR
ncbi:hypothetical protein ACVWZ6_002794 [Bradyrhizobium sp. GM6.1]